MNRTEGQAPAPGSPLRKARPFLLQLYRLGVLVAICWLVRAHHTRLRIDGDAPLDVAEVASFFPGAAELAAEHSGRLAMRVLDAGGNPLGFVVRTMPQASHITGYAGHTDTIIALRPDWTVLGIKIRKSEDTRTHVEDVTTDRHFMKTWNGMDWDKVGGMNLETAGVEGVSGATLTSMAIAEGIVHRFRVVTDEAAVSQPLRWRWRDTGLALAIGLASALAFNAKIGRARLRRAFQVVVIGYVGVLNGDLLAQSLLVGWAKSGIAWRMAPGLVLLAAAALLVPWATKRPLYCHHLCPHGAAQEWLGRLGGDRLRVKLPAKLARGLSRLPFLLLAVVVAVTMLALPLDLAGIEPFDAWIIRSAGWATLAIAAIGLLASLFIPQAYCRYGCPTGALLEFVRSHGQQDRFGARDWAAAALLALTAALHWNYHLITSWITGLP